MVSRLLMSLAVLTSASMALASSFVYQKGISQARPGEGIPSVRSVFMDPKGNIGEIIREANFRSRLLLETKAPQACFSQIFYHVTWNFILGESRSRKSDCTLQTRAETSDIFSAELKSFNAHLPAISRKWHLSYPRTLDLIVSKKFAFLFPCVN